jgi:hypothetical protein
MARTTDPDFDKMKKHLHEISEADVTLGLTIIVLLVSTILAGYLLWKKVAP